jgi:opacity protein-like surface antigen
MNTKGILFCLVVIVGLMICSTASAESANRFGIGLHYWVVLEDIDIDDVDENGYSWIFSYQRVLGDFIKLEIDAGLTKEGYAGSDATVWTPQAYFLIGKTIYAGVGVGINYIDDEFADNPFYALRAGLDFEILPNIFLDINANYRFEDWETEKIKEDIDTDTVTLGTVLRFQF